MPSTLDLDYRQTALYMVGIFTEAAAFAGLCSAVAARVYSTSDQVAADEADLIERFGIIQSRALPADIHRQLRDLLTATSQVLKDTEVRLPHIEQIDVVMTPASVLCYELYDSDEKLATTVGLNMGDDPLCPLLYNGPASVLIQAVVQ